MASFGTNPVLPVQAQEAATVTPTPADAEPEQSSALNSSSVERPIASQFIIRFKNQTSENEKSAFVRGQRGAIVQRIDALNILVIRLPEQAQAQPNPRSPIVESIEQDYYIDALDELIPDDPRYVEQWALPAIGAPSAWVEMPADTPKVTVAVIDSGICADHPDLDGRSIDGWDFLENDATPQDDFGHGCSVSGVIAANIDNAIGIAGVAPNAQIMPLRVLNASGVGSYSNVAAAIVYAADHGAQVINLSLGGSSPSAALESAIHYAISKDVIVVAAAGNNGIEGALYPAAYPDVIAVGSVDRDLHHSSFSNYGPQIDIWAPGRDLLTLKRDGGYTLVSGTSFAAPYVAGAHAIGVLLPDQVSQIDGLLWLGENNPSATDTATPGSPTYEPEGNLTPSGEDTVTSLVSVGGCAVVTNTNGVGGLAVRSGPASTYTLLKRIPDGTFLRITGGPASGSGLTWWQHDQGGWSAESYNGIRYLTDTSCGGNPGRIYVASDIELVSDPNHAWPPYEGDKLIGRFTLGNNGGQTLRLEGYGIRLRRNGSDYWDFLNTTARDLTPGQTVRFDQNNERPLATGHYRAEITWKILGQDWQVTSAREFDVAVRPNPSNIQISTGLQLSPTNPTPGQSVNARVTVKNTGSATFYAQYFGIKGRYTNGDLNYDYGWIPNFSLAPGATYTFDGNRSFDRTGNYWFTANYQDTSGNWNDVKWSNGTTNYLNLTVNSVVVNPGCFTLTISAPNGSVARDKPGNCNNGNGYLGGTVIRLTATPNSGYAFSSWSGGITGIDNPLYITISGNTTISANFAQITGSCFTLTTTANPGGTISNLTPYNCTGGYTAGTRVTLQANPNPGLEVSGWMGVDSRESKIANVIMNGSRSVSASFERPVIVLVHGIQALSATDVSHNTGLVKLNNQNLGNDDFGVFGEKLLNEGYEVYVAHLDSGPSGTPSINTNAEYLADQLSILNDRKVVLIDHSMGGLVGRAYIGMATYSTRNNVVKLITLGTPHNGSPLGGLACQGSILLRLIGEAIDIKAQQAGCEFDDEMAGIGIFNKEFPLRNRNIEYAFIGGTSSPFTIPFTVKSPHDGAVETNSALGVNNKPYSLINDGIPIRRFTVSASHTGAMQSWYPSYFVVSSNDTSTATATYTCVLHILNANKGDCNALTATENIQPQLTSEWSLTALLSGHLTSGQFLNKTVPIDIRGPAEFTLSWTNGTIGFTLTDPSGTDIDPSYAESHPAEVEYASNTTDSSFPLFSNYRFNFTTPGIYTLHISAGDVGIDGSDYSAIVAVESPRLLRVATDNPVYPVGSTVLISASLENEGIGLSGASVQAKLYQSGIEIGTLNLIDQGNGLYTATYPVPNLPGYISINITAQGTDNGVEYARENNTQIVVSPSNVSLTDQYSEGTSDLDRDGLFDNLNIAVGISASSAQGAEAGATAIGNYMVSADLVDGTGEIVAHTVTGTTLASGTSNVVLPFNGDDIRASNSSGPYELTNVTIIDQETSAPAVWQAANAWTTSTYDPQDFSASCFVVNANVSGNGTVSVDPAPNCNNGLQYAAGTVVTLTAQEEGGGVFTHWAGDIEDSSATVTVTVNSDLDTTANFNPSNSVFVIKAFTLASAQAASLDSNAMPLGQPASNDLESASVQGNYNAGDTIEMIIRAQNTTGTDTMAYFEWTVEDPVGRIIYEIGWNGDLTTYNSPISISSVPYNHSQDVRGATKAIDDPALTTCNRLPGTNSVWYKYTTTRAGLLSLDTVGSSYDTMLAVWSGTRGNLSLIRCNDDIGNVNNTWNTDSALAAQLQSGTVYYIEVSEFNGEIDTEGASTAGLQEKPQRKISEEDISNLEDKKVAAENGILSWIAPQGDREGDVNAQLTGGQLQLHANFHRTVPSSVLYMTENNETLRKVDQSTGSTTVVGNLDTGSIVGLSNRSGDTTHIYGVEMTGFGGNGPSRLVKINTKNGTSEVLPVFDQSVLGITPAVATAIAISPATPNVAVVAGFTINSENRDFLWKVNVDSGLVLGPAIPTTESIQELTYSLDGSILYGTDSHGRLVKVNSNTGVVTLIGDPGLTDHIEGLAFRPRDGALFAIDAYSEDRLVRLNPDDGSVVEVLGSLGVGGPYGLAFVAEDNIPDTTGVFRPTNGFLFLKNQNTTGFADMALNYGLGGDYPVVGDWDGNGTVTIGIYRNGKFYLRNSNSLGFADLLFAFGVPGDQPIAGDWDGDGVDTIGVYRPATGLFLLRNSNTAGDAEMSFYLGNTGDVGIAGDWDGNGMDTTGVFRPSNGVLFLKNTNATGYADIALNYGLPGDKPVTGDWDGDGDATIGVYRGNTFYLRNENTNGFADIVFSLGNHGDHPIAGNWDGIP